MTPKNDRTNSRHQTQFVRLDSHKCAACWKCIDVCRLDVIGNVNILIHKHAVFRHPERCSGCGLCVKICENEAIVAQPGAAPDANTGRR